MTTVTKETTLTRLERTVENGTILPPKYSRNLRRQVRAVTAHTRSMHSWGEGWSKDDIGPWFLSAPVELLKKDGTPAKDSTGHEVSHYEPEYLLLFDEFKLLFEEAGVNPFIRGIQISAVIEPLKSWGEVYPLIKRLVSIHERR